MEGPVTDVFTTPVPDKGISKLSLIISIATRLDALTTGISATNNVKSMSDR